MEQEFSWREIVCLPGESRSKKLLDRWMAGNASSWNCPCRNAGAERRPTFRRALHVGNHVVHLEALQGLALRISGERSVDAVLQSIVHGLAQQPSVALARVWVTEPGDVCGSCHMRAACPDQTVCLHLLASAGTSLSGAVSCSVRMYATIAHASRSVRACA